MRTCNACGVPYPETTEYFYKRKAGDKVRLDTICKTCVKAKEKQRRENRVWHAKKYKPGEPIIDEVLYTSFKCRACGKPTKYHYVAAADLDRMKNKFSCSACKDPSTGTYCPSYISGDTRASELPYMDTGGSDGIP